MTAEETQAVLMESLRLYLPQTLQNASQIPIRYLARQENGSHAWAETLETLEAPQELLAQQAAQLEFPAVMLHYATTDISYDGDECPVELAAHSFTIDLAITHEEPEILAWLWLRYAEAVRAALKLGAQDIKGGVLLFTGQQITEDGPYQQVNLRRGSIGLQVVF